MKKLLAILLAVAMCVPMLCISAAAAGDYSVKMSRSYGNGYTYVTLTSPDGDVYYTTDGSKPTTASAECTGKIKVTEPCTLRIAVYDGKTAMKRYSAAVNVRIKYPTVTLDSESEYGYVYKVTTTNNAAAYYTTDGTTPSSKNGTRVANGIIYAEPGSVLKIAAIKGGWIKSNIRTINVPAQTTSDDNEKISPSEFEAEVIRLINEERAKNGLSALTTTTALMDAAQTRADELVSKVAHTRPDGRNCFTVLKDYNIIYGSAAENVAAGQATPQRVVEAWMGSKGHRANILNPYIDQIGVGYTYSDSGYRHYWAQLFVGTDV